MTSLSVFQPGFARPPLTPALSVTAMPWKVAAELYMGLRTVEAHLSATYRKLGVRSRSALARAWAQR